MEALYLGAAPVQGPLGVVVGDGSTGNVYADQRPVDLQMDGDQQQVLLEDVDLNQRERVEHEKSEKTPEEGRGKKVHANGMVCCCHLALAEHLNTTAAFYSWLLV